MENANMKRLAFIVFTAFYIILFLGCATAPKSPAIIGVKEGEIYGRPVVITLDKAEKGVKYIATIDNKEYQLGSCFTNEGIHTLVLTASLNNKSTVSIIDFEIDTIPPNTPTVQGLQEGGIYSGSVNIGVQQEEGVIHTAIIDGNEYRFNTPFDEEGEHTLKVTATKERNNLSSEKNMDFSIDNTVYTKKEVDYFVEIALGSEYGGSPYVKKWLSDVKIKVGGNPTHDDLVTLKKVVFELNSIIQPIDLSVVENDENINIYFVPQGDFSKYIPGAVMGNWAYFTYYTKDRWEIEKAVITIGTFGSEQRDRNNFIREELTQALGMGNDSPRYRNSIFYETEGESLNEKYSKLDKKVIEILYRTDITLGMDKEEIFQVLENRIKK